MTEAPTSTSPWIVAHRGAFSTLPGVCDDLAVRRVIAVAGSSADKHAAEARALLGPRWGGRFSDPLPHVLAKEANLAVASAQEIHADSVLAIGGGSAIGYGKIIALALRLPLIAVPTTYAGAEMTDRFAVTTDRGKETGRSERVLPRVVIRDPNLTVGMPPEVIASSGMIAVGHCLESLTRRQLDHRTGQDARTALRMLWSTLPELLQQPDNPQLHERALQAAGLAGAAAAGAGSGLLTLLAEHFGGGHSVDHGALVGCLAPRVLELDAATAAGAALAEVAGNGEPGPRALTGFVRRLGLPTTLTELGITDGLDTAAAAVTRHPDCPGVLGSTEVHRLLTSA
jgi:alcohol dehydrogenase class IV